MHAPLPAPLQAKDQPGTARQADFRPALSEGRLVDNRAAAVAQGKLAATINASPQVLQQKALSDAVHNSPRMLTQRQTMDPQGDLYSAGATQLAQEPVPKASNSGLPDRLKSGIEALSGMAMDHVKVHYNSSRPAPLNALAYAQGSEIHLAPGQEQHLPHEAWHVVQQAQRRVQPTIQMEGGVAVNNDMGLEHEADVMGARALSSFGQPRGALHEPAARQGRFAPVQRFNLWSLPNKLVGNSVSDALLNLGSSVVSTVNPLRDESRYGPLTGRGFGSFIEAHLRPGHLAGGTATGGAPENSTWNALTARRQPGGEQSYIQGHLLNANLRGPGGDWRNLVPLTRETNATHSSSVEEPVKTAANTPGNEVVYRVRPVYGNWPWQWPSSLLSLVGSSTMAALAGGEWQSLAKLHDAEAHVPHTIQCDWWVTDKAQKTTLHSATIRQRFGYTSVWVIINGQVEDISNKNTVWNVIEHSLAGVLRTYLLSAGEALIPVSTIAIVQAMTAEQMVMLVRRLFGGWDNGLKHIADNASAGAQALVHALVERFLPVALNDAILAYAGSPTTGTRQAAFPSNRELRGTLESLSVAERELILDPAVRDRRPPERFY